MPDARIGDHRVELHFDGGGFTARLICPPTGCEPATYCMECHKDIRDEGHEPCGDCPTGDEGCWLKAWCPDSGLIDWLNGSATLLVETEFLPDDECPRLEIVAAGVAGALTADERIAEGHSVASENTRAHVYYVARCRRCGDSPNGYGDEGARTERAALEWAVREAGWYLAPSGVLYCQECGPCRAMTGEQSDDGS